MSHPPTWDVYDRERTTRPEEFVPLDDERPAPLPAPRPTPPPPARAPRSSDSRAVVAAMAAGAGLLLALVIGGAAPDATTGEQVQQVDQVQVDPPVEEQPGSTTVHTVEYRVTGSGPVTITYADGDGAQTTVDAAGPWTHRLDVTGQQQVEVQASPTANAEATGTLTCTLVVDGTTVASQTLQVTDAGTSVTCTGWTER